MISHEAAGAFPEGRKLRIDASTLLQRIDAAFDFLFATTSANKRQKQTRVKVELAACKTLAKKAAGFSGS